MATIWVFAASLFVALALVIIKAIELKRSKKNLFLQLISKLDSVSLSLLLRIKFRSLQFVQTARYIALVQIKLASKNMFDKMRERALSEYKLRQDRIMGRRDISNKGSVSFYLKKITEDKGNNAKGKIEDSL